VGQAIHVSVSAVWALVVTYRQVPAASHGIRGAADSSRDNGMC